MALGLQQILIVDITNKPFERKVSVLSSKFKVTINKTWCKGCGLCVAVCPKNVLELDENIKSDPLRPEDCIGCRQCENICPDLAITVGEGDPE
jgi:2-oxoglutarate ferredoxin oxidoreductase subunit delta